MTDHRPEPWIYDSARRLTDTHGETIITDGGGFSNGPRDPESEANSRRIVACVNACAGIPTEQLGDVKDLVTAAEALLIEWDQLTSYGSPMAKAANERIAFARAALAPFRKD